MTESEKLAAFFAKNASFDGVFYTAVKTTGIFCRPSCRCKTPLAKNIIFYDSAEEAIAAGFRPCKRCRPDLIKYSPSEELAKKAKSLIDEKLKTEASFTRELMEVGASKRIIDATFKAQYGLSINEYTNKKRIENSAQMLLSTDMAIVDIAYACGFESISSFYRIFGKVMGQSPALYRKTLGKGEL